MSDPSVVETYRALHSTIKYAEVGDRPVRSVLVVDVDRDTPSDVAQNIALAFSRAGDNCALVDAGFRSDPQETPGFSDLISGLTAHEVEPAPDENGLHRVGPGTRPNPDLLAGDAMPAALQALRQRFDFLVLTCAPLPEFGDAIAIAPCVDTTILVISAGDTSRDAATRSRDALQRVGAHILGIVMIERPRSWF